MLRNANAHAYHIKPPSPVTTRSNGSVVSTQGYTLPVTVATPLHHTQRAFVTVPRAASACASVAWMTQRYFCSIARASRAHSFIINKVQKKILLRARRLRVFSLFCVCIFLAPFTLPVPLTMRVRERAHVDARSSCSATPMRLTVCSEMQMHTDIISNPLPPRVLHLR